MIANLLRYSCKFFIVVIIILCTIEICARIDDSLSYDAPFFLKYTSNRLRGADGGIPHNIPNASFEKWKNNNLGFRGPGIQLNKKKGVERIVCLGASESYGLHESPGMEWPAQLRNLLHQKSFEVINASVVGLSLRQYRAYLSKYVLPLKPDKIIVYVNPFFSACRFERNKATGGSKPQSSPTKKRPMKIDSESVESGFQWRSRAKIKQVLKGVLAENFPSLLLSYQIKNLKQQIVSAEEKYLKGKAPVDKVSNESLEKYRETLSSLVRFLKDQGVEVVLTTYPALISSTNIDQYPEVFLDNRRFCIACSFTGMVNILDRFRISTLEVAVDNKVEILDLALLVPKSLELFGDNVHYTDRGAAIVAELLAEKFSVINSTGSQLEEKE